MESPKKAKIDPKAANIPSKTTQVISLRLKLSKRSFRHNVIRAKYKATINVSIKARNSGWKLPTNAFPNIGIVP